MPFNCTLQSITLGAYDVTGQLVTFHASFQDTIGVGEAYWRYFRWGLDSTLTSAGPLYLPWGRLGSEELSGYPFTYTPGTSYAPGWGAQSRLYTDGLYVIQARVEAYSGTGQFDGIVAVAGQIGSFKTNALPATSSDPTATNVTTTTADIACDYQPFNLNSSATVKLQYKRTVDVGWTDAGAADQPVYPPGGSIVHAHSIARSLSGLLPSTQYDVRLSIQRATLNDQSYFSNTIHFTTLDPTPTVETLFADGISIVSATLHGRVHPNSLTVTYWFEWGLTTAYGSTTPAQGPSSGTTPIDYNAVVGPLAAETIYHFRAVAFDGVTTYLGEDKTFSTSTEAHIMPSVYQHFAKHGVATDFFFCVETPSSQGSDRFCDSSLGFVAGDAKVDKDGGGLANVSALPTRIGSQLFKWAATAAEMTANKVNMLLVDQNGPGWRDMHIAIETRLLLGQIDVDATQIGGNTHAMSLIGVGTGYGLFAKGSSGIRGEAQGTSGHGILGVGIGAGFGLAGSGGANPTNILDSLEGVELATSELGDNMTFANILQLLKQRFAFKIDQDSSFQRWYRKDSTTVLATRTVSDDLVTQIQQKLF